MLRFCVHSHIAQNWDMSLSHLPLSSNTPAFSPPPGIRGIRGPLSAEKLLLFLPDPEGDPSPRQWAPPQLGPEEVQGSHLFLWAQDDSRNLHQSRRRYVLRSPKFPNIALGPKAHLFIPLQLPQLCLAFVFEPWLEVYMPCSAERIFLPSTGIYPFTLFNRLSVVILSCGQNKE